MRHPRYEVRYRKEGDDFTFKSTDNYGYIRTLRRACMLAHDIPRTKIYVVDHDPGKPHAAPGDVRYRAPPR